MIVLCLLLFILESVAHKRCSVFKLQELLAVGGKYSGVMKKNVQWGNLCHPYLVLSYSLVFAGTDNYSNQQAWLYLTLKVCHTSELCTIYVSLV